jgi:hypothetical protein
MPDLRDFRVHTCALNARDLDTLAAQAVRAAPCFCDGEWVGEGPEGVRQALEREFKMNEDAVVRLGTVDGEPAVVEFDGGGVERATLRFRHDPRGRIRELRIDHRQAPPAPPAPPPAAPLVEMAAAPEP